MNQLLIRACEVVAQDANKTFDEVVLGLGDMTTVPFYVRGDCACVALMRGCEIHLVVFPEWRNRTLFRRRIRSFLYPLLQEFGMLTTRLLHESRMGEFVERIGFRPTWSDENFRYFMMTTLPYGKGLQ